MPKTTILLSLALTAGFPVGAATITPKTDAIDYSIFFDEVLPDEVDIAYFPGYGFRGKEECTKIVFNWYDEGVHHIWECQDQPYGAGKGGLEKWAPPDELVWTPYVPTTSRMTPTPVTYNTSTPPWTPPPWDDCTIFCETPVCYDCVTPVCEDCDPITPVPLGKSGWFMAFILAALTTYGVYRNALR